MTCARHLRAPLVGIVLLLTANCSNTPTYPKTHLAESLQDIFTNERLATSVRFLDHTLAVQLDYPNALSKHGTQFGIGPDFDEATRKVLTGIHRVLLSSDAAVRFYVLLLSDPKIPGAYLTIVRYMDDVRRANANMIDTPEMFARTVLELNFVGPERVTLEQYVPRDIQMEEFLSWQLARRIQSRLTEELEPSGTATVGRCGGVFENGEFAFTLDVTPKTLGTPLDEITIRKTFQASTNVIAKVLSNYHFDGFKGIRLIYPATGRNLVLPKTQLRTFL